MMTAVLTGYGVLYSTSYQGNTYSRVRPTRVERTLEYVVTSVAVDSRVQKLPRVCVGAYTGVDYFVAWNSNSKWIFLLQKQQKLQYSFILLYVAYIHSFIHSSIYYAASSRNLLSPTT